MLSGVTAALLAAAIGLLIVEAVALIVWMAEPRSSAPLRDALRTGSAFWLLGHGARLQLPAGSAGLIPLGLSAIFVSLAARAGASVARVRLAGSRRRSVGVAAGAVAIPYGLVAAAVAGISSSGGLDVSPLTAGLGGLGVGLVGAAVGAARELAMAVPKPTRWRAVGAGIGVAGGVLLAGAALLTAVLLVAHLHDAASLAKPAKAGAVGGFGLLAIQASLVPNVVAWSASYLLGPGFAIGAGTLVSPGRTHLGDVPGLPMLAGLPSSPAPWPLYALFVIPIAAGVLGGTTVVRRLPRTPKLTTSALLGAGVGLGVGLLAGAAAVLSGGPVTAGRLATVGPAALPVGLMALLGIGVPSALAAVGLSWHRGRVAVDLREPQRPTERLKAAFGQATDVRALGRSALRLPNAIAGGVVAGVTALPALPGRAYRAVFRRRTVVPLLQPEPGTVSLIKAPHDPYELFRDSLNEEPSDEVDEPAEANPADDVIDLTDEPLHADNDVGACEDDALDPGDPDVASDDSPKGRRPRLPRRLRRKPKVIKLPD